MSRKLDPERRKVVILAAFVAIGNGAALMFSHDHPSLGIVWMIVMAALLVYVVMKLVKLKKQRIRR